MLRMFMISDYQQLQLFIQGNQNCARGVQWVVNGDRLYFVREKREMAEIPAEKMINLSLRYATELNRII